MLRIELDPIRAWFVPRVTPYGGAPEVIKQGWVGVPLPLRYDRPSEGGEVAIGLDVMSLTSVSILNDSVSIISVDTLKSLRLFERHDAADWWDDYFGGAVADLAFAVEREDQIYPADFLSRIMPGIELFDQTEI